MTRRTETGREGAGYDPAQRAHIAVLLPRYLRQILEGRKTVEIRLTRTKRAPFGVVGVGDLLYLKQRSGRVRAVATAAWVDSVQLAGPSDVRALRRRVGAEVGADAAFWEQRSDARFATVIGLRDVCSLPGEGLRTKPAPSAWRVLTAQESSDMVEAFERLGSSLWVEVE